MYPQKERLEQAHQILQDLGIFEILREYSPTLAGTVPLGIDIPGSDLDVICEVYDLQDFRDCVVTAFGDKKDFRIKRTLINNLPTIVASFHNAGYPIEIFGQPRPIEKQNAYRHMQIEARLLAIGGEQARKTIRYLKEAGFKTEPAFAQYFCIEGDPYQRLLEMAGTSDQELLQIVQGKRVCVFCDIVKSRVASNKVYEDENTLAFMNLRQANEGHVLVIPKKHYQSIDELDEETAANLLQTVVKVTRAIKQSINPEGMTIWQSNGEAAGQEIEHVHFHVIPRYTNDQVIRFYSKQPPIRERRDLERLAAKIKNRISNAKKVLNSLLAVNLLFSFLSSFWGSIHPKTPIKLNR